MGVDVSRMSLMTFAMGLDILTGKISAEQTLLIAKECGVPSVDVMCVPEKKVSVYQDAVRKTGISVYCYITNISFFRSDDSIAAAIRQELQVAQQLGAKLLMIVPSGAPEIRQAKRMVRTAVAERMAHGFQMAVDLSCGTGITVCFETTPHDALCLSGTDDCRTVLDMVPDLGLVLDSANMLPHGDTALDAYTRLKDRIIYVHLKDVSLVQRHTFLSAPERAADGRIMQCTVWGQGCVPVRALYEKMLADGYTGRFAIEYIPPRVKKRTVDDHVQQLKRYLAY